MNKSRSDESDDVSDSHDEAEDAPEEEEDDEEPDDGDSDSSSSNASSSLSASTSASGATHSFMSHDNEFEQAKILPQQKPLSLPRGLCENPSIFREFFSPATWKALAPQERAHLQQFLPQFDGLVNADEEEELLEATVNQLFTGQLQHFGVAPIEKFRHNLEEGNYRPDVYELRKSIAKSKRREQRFQECERLSQLAKELFISREKFLQQANKSLPGAILKAEHRRRRQHTSLLYGDTRLSAVRARKRFYKELTQCTQSVGGNAGYLSADDESPQKDALTAEEWRLDAELQQSISDEISAMKAGGPGGCLTTATDKCIYATNFKRRADLTDEDSLRAEQHSKKSQLSNRTLKQCLLDHRRRKQLQPNLPDFETSDIRLRDVCARAQIGTSSKRPFTSGKQPGRKPKFPKLSNSAPSSSEPPALVPIQPHRYDEISQQDTRLARVSTPPPTDPSHRQQPPALHVFAERHERTTLADRSKSKPDVVGMAGNSHEPPYEPYSGIMDNDVELQQVEVETYGDEAANSNDSPPAAAAKPSALMPFVISKEIELPHSAELPEKVFQTPQKDRKRQARDDEVKGRSCRQNLNMSMPKLEPLSANPTLKSPKDRSSTAVPPGRWEPQSATTPASESAAELLLQDTHECFFSLLRELFCATPQYRFSHAELRHKVDQWLRNPIAALNNWYPQVNSWSAELRSALRFLAGDLPPQPEDYVPYVEYKKHLDIYQWIGAGRDSDGHLKQLCEFWLLHRNPPLTPAAVMAHNEELHREPSIPELITIGEQRVGSPQIVGDSLAGDNQLPVIPPSRCPTTWKVQPSTPQEIAEFQRQERERFEQPHKAYTYRMHGYESVVGPVKGIYNQVLAMTKAREHSMMVGDRPNFVTILTLVRDATACLPNGEGTRSDISELLKCSQYISRDASETVLQTIVSGALDRMHTEQDPCVQYDPRRKIWIYLHRHRSEEEFERMHQQHQNQPLLKAKKVPQRKPKPKGATTKSGDYEGATPAISASNLTPMPALVPSSPLVCQVPNGATVVAHQGPPKLTAVSPKSLPVPPLKYNIPTAQQHQKSLLKPAYNSQRDVNAPKQTSAAKTLPGLVGASSTMAASEGQQQMSSAFSATVGGKRVALNKPIIINQINQQVAGKTKNQLKPTQSQQQQPQNMLIPLSGLSGEQHQLQVNSGQETNVKTILLDNNQQFMGTEEAKQPAQSMKNIIRLVPSSIASSGAAVSSKSSLGGGKQQQQVIGQRNVLQQQGGGISIIANNSGTNAGTSASGPAGTIVKMSPQAFASLQHKPGQQIFLKQGSNATQHRVVGGNVLATGEQLQFKTVHVLSSSQEKQLQQQSDTTAPSSSASAATKPITVISQPQAVSRVLKATASNALLKQQQHQNIRNAATGQVVHVAAGSLGAPAGTQYAVVSQARSIISMGGQQRLVTTQAQAGRSPTVITTAATTSSPAAAAKEKGDPLPTKVFKKGNIVVAQPNSSMFTNLGGNLRVINASGVNSSTTITAPTQATAFQLANLQGKQVVFTSKSTNGSPSLGGVKNVVNMSANQVQQLQNAGIIIGGQTLKLQNNLNKSGNSSNIVTSQAGASQSLQTVIVGNQVLRVQQMPQGINRQATVATSAANNTFVVNNTGGGSDNNASMPKTFLLGGQPVKLQTSVGNTQDQLKGNNANSSGRVVLAMPGTGGQVFLSPSMQGASSTFNLKSLQNMKVVSLANLQQQQQIKTNATTTKLTELKGGGSTDGDVAS